MVLKRIIRRIGNFFNVGKKLPRRASTFVESHANEKIDSLKVCRVPISGIITKILNVVSFGLLNKVQEKMGYDKLFHLFLVINDKYVYEKNQVVNIGSSYKPSKDEQCIPINFNKNLTIGEFVQNAKEKMGDSYYKYDAFNQDGGTNCQRFVIESLRANGIQPPVNFIDQKAEEIAKGLPNAVAEESRTVTDLAALADFLRQAVGLKHGGVVSMPMSDYVREHQRLIDILERGVRQDLLEEAKRQRTEVKNRLH